MQTVQAVHIPSIPRTFERFHIPSLDGIRAIAVSIVFFYHAAHGIVPGGFGVTIFFFLSGFLITTLLRLEAQQNGCVNLRNFYLRRALRILPLMYIMLACATVAAVLIHAPLSKTVATLQALHLTNYLTEYEPHFPTGTIVLWSLAVEEHFYLIFPVAYIALRRWVSAPERQALVLLAVCAVVLVWRCILLVGFDVSPNYVMHATDCRIDSILFGCILALWRNPAVEGPQWSTRAVAWALPVSLVVLVITIAPRNPVFRETVRYTIQGMALFPVFIAAIRFSSLPPFRLLNNPAISFFGVLSYGFYLVHLPVILVLGKVTAMSEWPLVFTSMAVALGVTVLLHYGIERPCARMRRRLAFVHTSGALRTNAQQVA
jgi:peptidoglycan/LPS O-acetylase OafA/YrhL